MDTFSSIGGLRDTVTATIAASGSLSSAVDLGEGRIAGIYIPSTWTAASLTFQGSTDNVNFGEIYDDTGAEITWTVAASQFIVPSSFTKLLGVRYLKVRSGTAASPVTQTSQANLIITTLVMI